MDDAQVRAALSARGIDLDDLIARIDTESVWYPDAGLDADTVAIVVINPSPDPFDGIARMEVDFWTRLIRPFEMYHPDGEDIGFRIVDEMIGPLNENGQRRWRFGLEFSIHVPAETAVACGVCWSDRASMGGPASLPTGPRLPAYETDCHPGDLSNPVSLAEVSAHPESQ